MKLKGIQIKSQFFLEYSSVLICLIILALLPHVLPTPVATEILVYGLFAMGFNILLGQTGILSLGHAAYFGLGAFSTGILLRYYYMSLWVSLLGSILVPSIVSIIIGLMCIKRKGVYFAMLSAAFANIFYFLALSPFKHITGGEDGLKEIPPLLLHFPFEINLRSPINRYYLIYLIVAVSLFILWNIRSSPFGKALNGIRENENRMIACGYNTRDLKIFSLFLSALFSGLAGGLYVIYLNYVPLRTFHWLTSGRVLTMALLGGAGSFIGPILGASLFLFIEDIMSIITTRWEMFVGALLVLVIIFSPEGLAGIFKQLFIKIFRRSPKKSIEIFKL